MADSTYLLLKTYTKQHCTTLFFISSSPPQPEPQFTEADKRVIESMKNTFHPKTGYTYASLHNSSKLDNARLYQLLSEIEQTGQKNGVTSEKAKGLLRYTDFDPTDFAVYKSAKEARSLKRLLATLASAIVRLSLQALNFLRS